MSRTVDVIVIGGGAAGENVADLAQQHGLESVLVESDLVGGECTYWACMPSKALLRPTEVLAAAHRGGQDAPLPSQIFACSASPIGVTTGRSEPASWW